MKPQQNLFPRSNNFKKLTLSEECQKAIKEKKHAFNVYKKHKTFANLIEFEMNKSYSKKNS